jgi:WD40 repeat protein
MQPGKPSKLGDLAWPVIPDHTLLRTIGRGAYGEVWLARNVMGVLRAIKVIWRRDFDSQRPYDREFAGIQRFEPVSRSSAGLVHVLHVGRNDAEGYFFYVMELADAVDAVGEFGTYRMSEVNLESSETQDLLAGYSPRTLRSDLKRLGRLLTADCMRVGLDVVGGLTELHQHGLVHRDVKPGNIIYVHGRAKLADIGLVSAGGEGRTFVGTEGYIPPEGPGAPSADLYALGIALYEASTGFGPENFPDVPPEWLADQAGNEALEFHEIILKACEGQRERRYESAKAMQADLALLQSGRSLRRVRALEQRYARLRLSGIVGTILLACALIAVFFANYRARLAAESRAKETRLRQAAQTALIRAETAEQDARQQLYTALLGEARGMVHSGELGQRVRALDALRRAAAISNNVELRREVFAAVALPDLHFERDVPIGSSFTGAQLDPAFERVAICRDGGPVEIRGIADDRLLASLPGVRTNLPSYVMEWSSDGRFLAIKRDQRSARAILEVWDIARACRVLEVPDLDWDALSFHPRKPWLMTGQPECVSLWDVEAGRRLDRFAIEADLVHLVKLSPDGNFFAVVQHTPTQQIVTVRGTIGGVVARSWQFSEQIAAMAWHPTGNWVAIADHGSRVQLLDARTGESQVLGQHKAQATTLAFSPDGQYLISGGWEREMICWDMRTRQQAFRIALDSYHLQFSADGRRCATRTPGPPGLGLFQRLSLYAFDQPVAHREFKEDLGTHLLNATISPDGRWLAASGNKGASVWDLSSGGPAAIDTNAYRTCFFFTPDGRELFGNRPTAGELDGFRWGVMPATNPAAPPQLRRLPLRSPKDYKSLTLISNAVVMNGPKGSQLLSPDYIETGREQWVPTISGRLISSPDGRWLGIHPGYSSKFYVYRLPGLEQVAELTQPASIGDIQFSPLGDEVVMESSMRLEFWSTTTWQRTRTVTNFTHSLYMPDARALWLSKDLRTAGLYNAKTLELLLPLPLGILPLAVSSNGRYLAVSVDLRRLQVWDLAEVRQQLRQLGLDWRE